jgi:hypothetical protein
VVIEKVPRIHLLVSVFLTDVALTVPGFYGVSISPNQNKVDQFLSTIHSMSQLELASQSFYIELAPSYSELKEILFTRIRQLFPSSSLFEFRLETFQDWQLAANQIPKTVDLVLLNSNHDHVYVSEDVNDFLDFAKVIKELPENVVGQITHWPESVTTGKGLDWRKRINIDFHYQEVPQAIPLGTCLVSRISFALWWQTDFTGGERIVRPDNPFGPSVTLEQALSIVPEVELFRHLDGYGHSGVKMKLAGGIRPCCEVIEGTVRHQEWIRGDMALSPNTCDLPKINKKLSKVNPTSLQNNALLFASHTLELNSLSSYLKMRYPEMSKFLFWKIIIRGITNDDFRRNLIAGILTKLKFYIKRMINFLPNEIGNPMRVVLGIARQQNNR